MTGKRVKSLSQAQRLKLAALGVAFLLSPLLLPLLAGAWLALNPARDAAGYVVVHLGPLWPLAPLGLGCVGYAAFARGDARGER